MRPGAQRKEGEQPAGRWLERKLLAITFFGHCAQQPTRSTASPLYLRPGCSCSMAAARLDWNPSWQIRMRC
jgi:hypothetical protein